MIIFYLINQQPLTFMALETRFMKNISAPQTWTGERFWDRTLFLSLLHQIQLRLSGIRFWRLGTPVTNM